MTGEVAASAVPAAAPDAWAGLLLLDKPVGVTSHDVVDRVRRRLRLRAVGHLGTLDPGASGLLVLALGAATRCATVWQGGLKTYEATVRFGVVTSTQDLQGEVLERREVTLDEAAVRAAATGLLGTIAQVPPMVSARRVGGQRLYRLARRGQTVERPPRPVCVHTWEWLDFDLPEASFRVVVSGGTYVRTLAHDLGERLGVGGALKSLRRLRSEPFGLERATAMRDLDSGTPAEVLARSGVALAEALRVLPMVTLDEAATAELGFGRRPEVPRGDAPLAAGPRSVAFYGADGGVLALGELVPLEVPGAAAAGRALACPHVVFPWAVRQGRP